MAQKWLSQGADYRPPDLMATFMGDEVVIVEAEQHAQRARAGKHGRMWPLRWGTFVWNRAMVLAAVRSGVHDFWKDANGYGKLTVTKERFRETFWSVAATEVEGFDPEAEPLQTFLHVRSLWTRLQEVLSVYRDAKEYRASMTETEWMAFLQQGELSNAQRGHKKYKTLETYCTLLAWTPAGEDDSRYPLEAKVVEQASDMEVDLQLLVDAFDVHSNGMDEKKEFKCKEDLKTARKDAQSLLAERFVTDQMVDLPSASSR